MGDWVWVLAAFSFANGITLAGVVLGAIVAVALTVAYFRASLGKGTIEVYRQDNEALRGRVQTQDADLADKDKTIAELNAKLVEKDTQIKHITDIATGAVVWEEFRRMEEDEHKKINEFMGKIEAYMKGQRASG